MGINTPISVRLAFEKILSFLTLGLKRPYMSRDCVEIPPLTAAFLGGMAAMILLLMCCTILLRHVVVSDMRNGEKGVDGVARNRKCLQLDEP